MKGSCEARRAQTMDVFSYALPNVATCCTRGPCDHHIANASSENSEEGACHLDVGWSRPNSRGCGGECLHRAAWSQGHGNWFSGTDLGSPSCGARHSRGSNRLAVGRFVQAPNLATTGGTGSLIGSLEAEFPKTAHWRPHRSEGRSCVANQEDCIEGSSPSRRVLMISTKELECAVVLKDKPRGIAMTTFTAASIASSP